jgi:lysyl-tRNA synthetase class 2
MSEQNQAAAPQQDENQIIAERRAKLAEIRAKQSVAFPNDFQRKDFAGKVTAAHADKDKDALEAEQVEVAIAGRMVLKRVMGKASFATVQDSSGRVQFYINDEGVGAETHEAFKHWDLGDIIAAKGVLFKTNKGELSDDFFRSTFTSFCIVHLLFFIHF